MNELKIYSRDGGAGCYMNRESWSPVIAIPSGLKKVLERGSRKLSRISFPISSLFSAYMFPFTLVYNLLDFWLLLINICPPQGCHICVQFSSPTDTDWLSVSQSQSRSPGEGVILTQACQVSNTSQSAMTRDSFWILSLGSTTYQPAVQGKSKGQVHTIWAWLLGAQPQG